MSGVVFGGGLRYRFYPTLRLGLVGYFEESGLVSGVDF